MLDLAVNNAGQQILRMRSTMFMEIVWKRVLLEMFSLTQVEYFLHWENITFFV